MFSPDQFSQFQSDGFLHLPGFVPQPLVEAALHAINHRIGAGIPEDQLATWQSQSFFPDLASQPVISDLFNTSGLHDAMTQLLGEGNAPMMKSGQLALRFPREPGAPARPPFPHIDGVHSKHNGVPPGTVGSFTALVGVYLTPLPREDAGNFTVWPGSHLKMQEHFREHGLEELLQGRTPKLDLAPPLQLRAQPGDAVIAHYQLLHSVASNVSPYPRYAVFFRVTHPQHHAHRMECLTDVWREWPGLQRRASLSC